MVSSSSPVNKPLAKTMTTPTSIVDTESDGVDNVNEVINLEVNTIHF